MGKYDNRPLQFTKAQLHDAFCRICQYPDNPDHTCELRRGGIGVCEKCTGVAKSVCKKTSLMNETIYEGY